MAKPSENSIMFSRASKKSHINTIEYEIRMLKFALAWLAKNGTDYQPEEELYAILECFLLHYRNLVNFLSGKGGSSGDLSMAAPDVWVRGEYERNQTEELRRITAPIYTAYSADISTYLAHCTQQRYEQSKQWQPGRMYEELMPAIAKFEEVFCEKGRAKEMKTMLTEESYGTASWIEHWNACARARNFVDPYPQNGQIQRLAPGIAPGHLQPFQ
jgi:hypothetical protein